ncbi:hypothetical protein AB9F45_26075 [Rhizobium leguminosarum]|uniref:hypothetical protein n=1 Tax=Rhizobium leguminosarum TaxID=384 RepID=UPI003F9B202C
MTIEDYPYPTLRDLAEEIGHVQIYWSFLEAEMRKQLIAAGYEAKIARGALITHWRTYASMNSNSSDNDLAELMADVERLAARRNLLAHGIQSVTANPWEKDTAVVVCAAPDGLLHHLTIGAIQGLSAQIDAVRRSMRRSRPSTPG